MLRQQSSHAYSYGKPVCALYIWMKQRADMADQSL